MLQGRLPLLLAAVFAALAALVAFLAVKQKGDEITQGWQPVDAIVAKRDLKAGETLSRENLEIAPIPQSLAATGSVITEADRKQGRVPIFGQKLAMDMRRGDPLLFQHIKTLTGMQHLAGAVQTEGRAVSIRVNPESSVHHWVEPGDRVDILGTFSDPRTREMVSVTLLQNVIVLATGRIGGQTNRRLLSESEKAYATVTVQVLPEAAEMLVLGQELGTLYLTLRNPDDNKLEELAESKTTMTTLLTGERSKRLSTKQNKMFKVEIIRGTQSVQQMVP
jgi:pilus assembly protein CpaB